MPLKKMDLIKDPGVNTVNVNKRRDSRARGGTYSSDFLLKIYTSETAE